MHDVRVRLGISGKKPASRLAAWGAQLASPRARPIWRAARPLLWLTLGLLGFDLYVFGWVIPRQFTRVPVAPLYPPVAILLAVLLVTPPRRWWLYLIAAYAFQVALFGWFGYPLWFNLVGEAPTVIEPLVAAYLLARLLPLPPRFAGLREVSVYAGCVVLAAVLSAFMGGGIQALLGRPYWPAWRGWVLSDGLASLVLAPTIVLWATAGVRGLRVASRWRAGELALWCGAFLLLGPVAFRAIQDADLVPALIFVPVPVLLWAAARFGPRGIGTALSLVMVLAVVGVGQGTGPFAARSISAGVLIVQVFLACIGVPLFLLAASIEERRHGQAELARSEGRYRAYFELNGVGAAEIDLDTGRFVRVNDALCRITGYPRGELLRLRFGDITHPEDREENLRVFRVFRRQTAGAPASLTIEKRYVRRDGATIWVQIDATLVGEVGGRPLHVVTVVQDVTERRRAEAAVAHLAAIVTSADDAIASKTLDGIVTSWNAGAERMFGYTAAEMLGQPILRLIPPDRHEEEDRILAHLRAGEHIEHLETVRLAKDWRPLEVSLTMSPIRDGAGAIIGASTIVRDITARKRLEREREEAHAAAKMANEELRRLQAITDTALSPLALDDLLRELLERVHAAVGGDSVGILLLDAAGRQLTFRAVRGPEGPVAVEATIPVGRGFSGRIAATRAPLIMDDLSTIELLFPPLWASRRSAMGVPLLVEGRLLGVVYASSDVAGRFGERDVQLLQRAADRMALAIDRARLFEEERAARAEAERQAEQLDRTFEGMTDGLVVYDAQGCVTRTNAAAQRILGLGAAPPDSSWLTVPHRAARYAVRDGQGRPLAPEEWPLMRILSGQAPDGACALDVRMRTLGGHEVELDVSAAPLRDREGRLVGAVSILHDQTERRRMERALRTSEARFRTAFESASVGMSLVAPTGRLLEVNRPLAEMLGYSREELLERTVAEITYPADLGANQEVSRRALAGEIDCYQLEKRYVHKRGHVVWGRMSAGVVRDKGGRPLYLVGQLEDITEHKRAEEALRASEARYRAVVETQTELITRYRPDTTITFVNDANCRHSGKSREELVGTKLLDHVPPSARAAVQAATQALLERPGVATIEHESVAADGSRRWQEWVNRTILDAEGRVVELQGIGRDITQRKEAEAALERLTARLLAVQDEERRRLARDLHDGTAQTIAALGLNVTNLRSASRGGIRDRGRFERILADSQQLVEQALRETRTLAYVLHPPQLDEGGLIPALEWYVKGFSRRSGIRVALEASAGLGRLPEEVERALYRIVAECLANVHRHSGSPSARIALTRRARTVRLVVADRGGGIAGAASLGGREEPEGVLTLGVGIPGMRQRVRQLNGWLKIRSSGRGTIMIAVVPVPEAATAGVLAAGAEDGVERRA